MNLYKRTLLFGLLWCMSICAAYAVPANDTNDDVENVEGLDLITDNDISVIENYPSLIVEFLNFDLFLKQSGYPILPVYTFDFRNLFSKKIAFLYAMRINKSRFAFCLGVGRSIIAYAFPKKEDGTSYTLKRDGSKLVGVSNNEISNGNSDDLSLFEGEEIVLDRSAFKASYIDILLRFRFNTLLEEPKGGVFIWVGTKFGYLYSVCADIVYHTKFSHKERALRRSGNFDNIDKVAWFGEVGLGYKRFGINVGYNFRPIFAKNNIASIRPLYISVSADLF